MMASVVVRRILLASFACLSVAHGGSASEADLDHALFRAIRDRDGGRIARLLQQGTPVELRSSDGTTPLMVAALHGDLDGVELLLQHGADPNAANDRGATPLLWAVSDRRKVELLVEHGAQVNARSALGNTPLLVAASMPDATTVVETLLAHEADVIARNGQGTSALANACAAANLSVVRMLLARADESDQLDQLIGDDGPDLLETVASLGTLDMLTFLLDQLAAANGGDVPDTGQAVNAALRAQHVEMARVLIEAGGNIDRKMDSVPTLIFATYNETGDTAALKALLQRGVDVGARNYHDETALTWARRRGHSEMIEALVEAGTPEQPDEIPKIPERSVNLHAGNRQQLLTDAVTKSIALLQHSSDLFLQERKTCVSCHHQNLPAVAIGWARDRGIPIDQDSVARMVRRQQGQLGGDEVFINRCYQLDSPAPVPSRYLGWGLWGFSALGYPRTEVTDATAWYLAATQRPDGHWTSNMLRPPIGDADFTSTVLAMQVLQLYPIPGRSSEFRDRIERAAQWLEDTPARYHQERIFQLLGLGWAGRSAAELRQKVDRLLADQRSDGGWSQLPKLKSDAWATGQTLVALRVAGDLSVSDPAYQRGLRFLLNTQFEDGSWFVKSRSWPFQPPFESGFPHGRDQWISAAATAWSVMAMSLALDPREARLPETLTDSPTSESTDYDREATRDAATPAYTADTPPGEITFLDDVRPILVRSCVGCHSGDEPRGTLNMAQLAPMLQGGETGVPAIVPGVSEESLLYIAAAGTNEELLMPPPAERKRFPPLSAAELGILKQWIDTGASWPAGTTLAPATD